MGFPVRYPISTSKTTTSKHFDRQRGSESDRWLGKAGGSVTLSFGGGDVDDERPELRE